MKGLKIGYLRTKRLDNDNMNKTAEPMDYLRAAKRTAGPVTVFAPTDLPDRKKRYGNSLEDATPEELISWWRDIAALPKSYSSRLKNHKAVSSGQFEKVSAAFQRGFIKAAVDARLVPSPSLAELQRELAGINTSIQQVGPSIGDQIGSTLLDRMNTAVSAGAGGLMGAGVGGSLGYWLGKDEEEKKDNRGMTTLLGALAGSGLGLAGGALMAPQVTAMISRK